MAIGAVIARPLFSDFISGGLGPIQTELRVNLLERWNANNAWASETGIEYAIWPATTLDLLGAPTLQGDSEATDASGEIAIDTTGVFNVSDSVLISIRKANAGPLSETVYGLAEETITEA